MSLRIPRVPRALTLVAALTATAATAPAAHAITPQQDTFLQALPTSVTETVTRDVNPVYPAVCPKFNVVVARGTDQAANQDQAIDGPATWPGGVYRGGPDSPVSVWFRMASELYFPVNTSDPKLTVATQMLRTDLTYPATNYFPDSAPAGTANLIRYLNRINVQCPSTRFVLLGYSQGAMVIGDTLSPPGKRTMWISGTQQLTTATSNAIVAVGLMANPGFNRTQGSRAMADYTVPAISTGWKIGTWADTNKGMNDGNFNPAYSGVNVRHRAAYPVKALPSPLPAGTVASDWTVNPSLTQDQGSKIRDFCFSLDYICQWGNVNSNVVAHEKYKTDVTPRRNLFVFTTEKVKPLV